MSKLIRDWKDNKLDPWNDVLARWLLMLGMVDRRNDAVYEDIFKKLEGIAIKDDTLHSAFKNWEEISSTHEQVLAYESRLKRVLDEEAAKREAVIREEEAKQAGEKIGKQIGVKIGEKRGKQIGEKIGEQKEKEEIARRLLEKGMNIEAVAGITELEKERIIEIQCSLSKNI